jgi:ubiquinol-cytochrome c reductase cytochrome c1 subunit
MTEYGHHISPCIVFLFFFISIEAKGANGGLWPKDLSRANSHNPGFQNYSYNLMTGYHYNAPFGLDVSEGRYFNPYFDHMIIGMPPQLTDGIIEYEDGTPASAPQMVFKRFNHSGP